MSCPRLVAAIAAAYWKTARRSTATTRAVSSPTNSWGREPPLPTYLPSDPTVRPTSVGAAISSPVRTTWSASTNAVRPRNGRKRPISRARVTLVGVAAGGRAWAAAGVTGMAGGSGAGGGNETTARMEAVILSRRLFLLTGRAHGQVLCDRR